MARRLVMFASASPAAGKTTTSAGLVKALLDRGREAVWVPDSSIFDRPELAELADAFRRREYPGPEQLLDGLGRLLSVVAGPEWIVFENNWLVGAEDLPWAQESWEKLVGFAREALQRIAAYGELTVIFLDLGLAEALSRQRTRDGDVAFGRWLASMRALPALELEPDATPTEVVSVWAQRLEDLWAACGHPLLRISAAGTRPEVLGRALDALGLGTRT